MKILKVLLSLLISVNMSAAKDRYGGVLFIGDSYAKSGSWPAYAADAAQIEDYKVSAMGGTGFVNDNNGVTFLTLLQDASSEKNKHYRWVFVIGGYNDHYHSAEKIGAAIDEFCANAKELFPNAQVVIGMCGWRYNDAGVQKGLEAVKEAYKQGAERNGAWYLEGIENVLREGKHFMEDSFHPDDYGGWMLGVYIAEYLMKAAPEEVPALPAPEEKDRIPAYAGSAVLIGLACIVLCCLYSTRVRRWIRALFQ